MYKILLITKNEDHSRIAKLLFSGCEFLEPLVDYFELTKDGVFCIDKNLKFDLAIFSFSVNKYKNSDAINLIDRLSEKVEKAFIFLDGANFAVGPEWESIQSKLYFNRFTYKRSYGIEPVKNVKTINNLTIDYKFNYKLYMKNPDLIMFNLLSRRSKSKIIIKKDVECFSMRIKSDGENSSDLIELIEPSKVVSHTKNTILGGEGETGRLNFINEWSSIGLYFKVYENSIISGHDLGVYKDGGLINDVGYLNSDAQKKQKWYFELDNSVIWVNNRDWILCDQKSIALFAMHYGYDGYYHWLVEILPGIVIFAKKYPNIAIRLLTPPLPIYALQSIDAFNLQNVTIEELQDIPIYINKVHVLSTVRGTAHTPDPYVAEVYKEIVPCISADRPRMLIYASRLDANRRVLKNEKELEIRLNEINVKPVIPGGMTFMEQVNLFSNADVVIGTHGAGLTNILFMKPGGVLVEIVADKFYNNCYQRLAQLKGIHYFCYIVPSEIDGNDQNSIRWEIDINNFLVSLKNLLGDGFKND